MKTQRQTNGDVITVDGQKPVLANSMDRERVAYYTNNVTSTGNNQPWKLHPVLWSWLWSILTFWTYTCGSPNYPDFCEKPFRYLFLFLSKSLFRNSSFVIVNTPLIIAPPGCAYSLLVETLLSVSPKRKDGSVLGSRLIVTAAVNSISVVHELVSIHTVVIHDKHSLLWLTIKKCMHSVIKQVVYIKKVGSRTNNTCTCCTIQHRYKHIWPRKLEDCLETVGEKPLIQTASQCHKATP